MTAAMEIQLVKGLTHAHAMEKHAIRLLTAATRFAGDDEIAEVYSALLLQAEAHERIVAARLEAYGAPPSSVRDRHRETAEIDMAGLGHPVPDTPIRLAETAFALQSHEVAAYRLLRGVAERAGDTHTASLAGRLVEQQEAATELVAATFPRVLDVALGDPATSARLR